MIHSSKPMLNVLFIVHSFLSSNLQHPHNVPLFSSTWDKCSSVFTVDMGAHFLNKVYKITTGFFVENTVVLAEGEMQLDGVFKVCFPFLSSEFLKFYFIKLCFLGYNFHFVTMHNFNFNFNFYLINLYVQDGKNPLCRLKNLRATYNHLWA